MVQTVSTSESPATQPLGRMKLRAALCFAPIALLVFGLGYSLLATLLGNVLFPHQAHGSLVIHDGRVIGSSLVAQPFFADRYFQPRPSAASFDPMATAGSNQAWSNPDLQQRQQEARETIAKREGITPEDVPNDLITQSGSGTDPHISPAAALVQVARVANARGLAPEVVQQLVQQYCEFPEFGLYGQERINVLLLNVALDTLR